MDLRRKRGPANRQIAANAHALPLRCLSACGAPRGARTSSNGREQQWIALFGAPSPSGPTSWVLSGIINKPRMPKMHRGNEGACLQAEQICISRRRNGLPALPLWESTRSHRECGEGSAANTPRHTKESAEARISIAPHPSHHATCACAKSAARKSTHCGITEHASMVETAQQTPSLPLMGRVASPAPSRDRRVGCGAWPHPDVAPSSMR